MRFAAVALAAAAAACATFEIRPAQFGAVRQVDYFREPGLPDRPLAPVVFHIRSDPEGTPRVEPAATLPPWLPGEVPNHRPHRPVLKVTFTTAENLSRAGESRGGTLIVDLYDCKTEAALDFLRLSPILWHQVPLPSAAATRAIERAARPRTYEFYVSRAFDPVRAGDATAEPVNLAHHPKDVCFEVIARDGFGNRLRTDRVVIPAAAIAGAIAAS